jgi:hypothetical protein
MEVLHRVESGFYRLAKVIEEAGEGETRESKKVLIEYLKCKKRAWVAEESLVQGPLVKLELRDTRWGGKQGGSA